MAGVVTVDFRAKELEVWRLLLEFDLSLRQLRVMGAVLKRSFGRGERSVRVPAQRYLAAWTGMAEEHVSVAVRELEGLYLLHVRRDRGEGMELMVCTDASLWAADRVVAVDGVLEEELAGFHRREQGRLIEREVSLKEAMVVTALEGEGRAAGGAGESSSASLLCGGRPGGNAADGLGERVVSALREGFRAAVNGVTESVTRDRVSDGCIYTSNKSGIHRVVPASEKKRVLHGDYSGSARGGGAGGKGALKRENWERITELLGEDELARNGAVWRLRNRDFPEVIEAVFAELAVELREGKEIRNRGAYATDLFKRFGGRAVRSGGV